MMVPRRPSRYSQPPVNPARRSPATAAAEDHPGRGGEEHGIDLGDLCCGQAEHPAGLAEPGAPAAGLEVGLEPSGGIAGALIQDDQAVRQERNLWDRRVGFRTWTGYVTWDSTDLCRVCGL
jgi:hypothetical protein